MRSGGYSIMYIFIIFIIYINKNMLCKTENVQIVWYQTIIPQKYTLLGRLNNKSPGHLKNK